MTTATKEQCYHGTLVAATVDTVNILNPSPTVTVVNRSGVSEIYFTINGVAPTVGGDNTYVLPAVIGALAIKVPQPTGPGAGGYSAANPAFQVQLISSGTPTYSVEVI